MRVSLEFVAFAEVPSVAAALAILDNPGCEDIGLLIDPLHFARMGSSPRDLEGVEYGRPHYAQFCDAAAQGPSVEDVSAIVEEALERRLSICAGALPLGALLRQNPAKLPLSIDCARNRCARAGPIRPTAPARFSN